MCVRPIWIDCGRSRGGRSIKIYDHKTGSFANAGMYVPCGKCPECMKKRQNEWFVRFHYEDKYWRPFGRQTWFGTLTYDDSHLPASRESAVKDWQAFLKQMNRKLGVKPRFYLTSEFGSVHGRIHFHFLLFGVPNSYDFHSFSRLVAECWNGRGFVQSCPATGKQFRYISKYVTKDAPIDDSNEWSQIQTFSKRPAVGFAYVAERLKDYLDCDDARCVSIDGYNYSVPRSYLAKVVSVESMSKRKAAYIHECTFNPFPDSPCCCSRYSEQMQQDIWDKYYQTIRSVKKKKIENFLRKQLKNKLK